ncbi:MAG: peptide chain release factor N(5)-glutamine methyltransferase [Campylobacterota bacterium]|nr:peptide chain release factor N(5)-glutamine methyltransferase [Campylobacterota bacterium]
MTIKQTIKHYSQLLKEVTHIPQKEVQTLILHILDKNVIWLHLNDDQEFKHEKQLNEMVKKRATHYPLEYIIGKASFYGELFLTKEGVLIPRPETELLVERCEKILKEIDSPCVVEIGTGSGIISVMLALLIDDIRIVAVDINDKALELAKQNAIKHKVEHKITFMHSDLFEKIHGDFDLCVSNPPYIADDYALPTNVQYEPLNALFGGNIGDELLKNIIDAVVQRKIPYLLCEMGYDQKQPLGEYLEQYKPKKVEFYQDYEKFDRGFEVHF